VSLDPMPTKPTKRKEYPRLAVGVLREKARPSSATSLDNQGGTGVPIRGGRTIWGSGKGSEGKGE